MQFPQTRYRADSVKDLSCIFPAGNLRILTIDLIGF